ncbi:MAG: DUF6020 family protein [Coriobacteriaceae bacterium]|nr:DUF6020 family protein [Coriobacteriaceae bacterium]
MTTHHAAHRADPSTPTPRRCLAFAIVIALALAVPIAIAARILPEEALEHMLSLNPFGNSRRLGLYLFAALAFIIGVPALYLIFRHAGSALEKLDGWHLPRALQFPLNTRGVLCATGIIAILWLPVFIMMAPGATTHYDTINQLYQYFTSAPTYYTATHEVVNAEFIDHHPVFDTLVMGAFVSLGRAFGSDMAGFALYTTFQGLLLAFELALCICYLERLGVPSAIRLALVVMVGIFPSFPIIADTMQKDSLHMVALVPWFLYFAEAIRSEGAALRDLRFIIAFIVFGILVILTKKTGMYLMIASLIVLLFALRGLWVQKGAVLLVPLLIGQVLFPAIAFPALNVAPGGSQEMVGMLYQHTVTSYRVHPDSFSADDRKTLDRVVDLDAALSHYQWDKTDGVKNQQRENMTSEDFRAFLGVWARHAISDPASYARAHLRCCIRLVAPGEGIPVSGQVSKTGIKYFKEKAKELGGTFKLDVKSWKPGQKAMKAVREATRPLFVVPPFSLPLTYGFWGGWIPILAFGCAMFGRRRNAAMLAPFVFTALLLLISPASLSRYLVAPIFLAPLGIGLAIGALRRERTA